MLTAALCPMQNIGVNGARTTSMQPPGVINAFQRDPNNDEPVLVFYALVPPRGHRRMSCRWPRHLPMHAHTRAPL